MSHGRPDEATARLAEHQHGVVHRSHAARAGLTPRMIATRAGSGRLAWATSTVLRIGGTPSTWYEAVMTAVLDAGTGSVASHRCAAQLHRLDAFGDRGRRWVEVTSSVHRHRRSALRHTSGDLEAVDIGRVAGIPCTTVTRTLCDLGAVVPRSRLEHAVDGALRDGLTDASTLRSALTALRMRNEPTSSHSPAGRYFGSRSTTCATGHRPSCTPFVAPERLVPRASRDTPEHETRGGRVRQSAGRTSTSLRPRR